MTRNSMGLASIVLVLAMASISMVVGRGLADGILLPVHWGLSGEPDGYASKWVGLFMPAGMTALIAALFYFLPALEPRRRNLDRSEGLYLWGWASLLLLGVALQLVMLSEALGWGLPVNRIVVGAIGIMFVMIGNQLGKSRSMYMVGIRTPWTLASEEVWIKTHRLGGKLMALAGLAVLGAALIGFPPDRLMLVMGVGLGAAAIVPVVYSYLLWRREKAAQPSE